MSTFTGLLGRYGQPATFTSANGREFVSRVFIQPVMSRSGEASQFNMSRLGEVDGGRFYLFAPPDAPLSDPEDIYITYGDKSYDIVRAETYRGYSGASHWEALLKIREVAADA